MTRRLFYIALGATAGVLLVRKITQTAEKLTPPKLVGGALDNLSDAIRQFGAEVREGMAEREQELRQGLGLDDDAV
ncbi:MAG: hypothetical protein QOG99_269 [Frankiales bacterium]|jgi:hypothetical protein|nr:hypothetical protein [Frankiales bacterium]MDX6214685.1 hypothetical protein [Frankiales bacterium]